jgi:hypothetical protein
MKAQAKEEKLRRQIGMFKPFAPILNVSVCSSYYGKTVLSKVDVLKKFTDACFARTMTNMTLFVGISYLLP